MGRIKHKIIFIYYYILSKIRRNKVTKDKIRGYLKNRVLFGDKKVQSAEEINKQIYQMIQSGNPFLVGRFGSTELFAIRSFDFEFKIRYHKALEQMQMWSGFFPTTEEAGKQFKDLMLGCIPQADIMGVWMLPFEEYYLKKYGNKNLNITYLLDLEPWSAKEIVWSSALAGKKVLVIHPFIETIQSQYKRREEIFPGTDILPEFELKTLKAVQTLAKEKDERFQTWFEALEWMYQEALKIDFDIAIIGCGAYGFPLAAKLKQVGKQVIHLAGATQLLFGIKGKRWEENSAFSYVRKYFNSAWVYPTEMDTPKQASKVEGGCYW